MKRDLSVNRQVARLLEERKMSTVRLAVLTGIPYERLCRVLMGTQPVYADELQPLARALGVSADKLLEL